ncbi:hypothetical protein PT974_02373 [Cladobotryum mycophilum]|uniref:Uncharacterized protein n=1 Tax=Cladobotryum mycophilum TaxID=491253 RepID=A0ABR0SY16_9HYPO
MSENEESHTSIMVTDGDHHAAVAALQVPASNDNTEDEAAEVSGPLDRGLVSAWSYSSDEENDAEQPFASSSEDGFASASYVEKRRAEFMEKLARRGPVGPEAGEVSLPQTDQDQEDSEIEESEGSDMLVQRVQEVSLQQFRREMTVIGFTIYPPINMVAKTVENSSREVFSYCSVGANFSETDDNFHQESLSIRSLLANFQQEDVTQSDITDVATSDLLSNSELHGPLEEASRGRKAFKRIKKFMIKMRMHIKPSRDINGLQGAGHDQQGLNPALDNHIGVQLENVGSCLPISVILKPIFRGRQSEPRQNSQVQIELFPGRTHQNERVETFELAGLVEPVELAEQVQQAEQVDENSICERFEQAGENASDEDTEQVGMEDSTVLGPSSIMEQPLDEVADTASFLTEFLTLARFFEEEGRTPKLTQDMSKKKKPLELYLLNLHIHILIALDAELNQRVHRWSFHATRYDPEDEPVQSAINKDRLWQKFAVATIRAPEGSNMREALNAADAPVLDGHDPRSADIFVHEQKEYLKSLNETAKHLRQEVSKAEARVGALQRQLAQVDERVELQMQNNQYRWDPRREGRNGVYRGLAHQITDLTEQIFAKRREIYEAETQRTSVLALEAYLEQRIQKRALWVTGDSRDVPEEVLRRSVKALSEPEVVHSSSV